MILRQWHPKYLAQGFRGSSVKQDVVLPCQRHDPKRKEQCVFADTWVGIEVQCRHQDHPSLAQGRNGSDTGTHSPKRNHLILQHSISNKSTRNSALWRHDVPSIREKIIHGEQMSVWIEAGPRGTTVVSAYMASGQQYYRYPLVTHRLNTETRSVNAPASMISMPLSKSHLFPPMKKADRGTCIGKMTLVLEKGEYTTSCYKTSAVWIATPAIWHCTESPHLQGSLWRQPVETTKKPTQQLNTSLTSLSATPSGQNFLLVTLPSRCRSWTC